MDAQFSLTDVSNRTLMSFSLHLTIQDHYFDVITNIVGLSAATLGDEFYWWIDPIGAIFLAVYTISNWSKTVLENAGLLLLSF